MFGLLSADGACLWGLRNLSTFPAPRRMRQRGQLGVSPKRVHQGLGWYGEQVSKRSVAALAVLAASATLTALFAIPATNAAPMSTATAGQQSGKATLAFDPAFLATAASLGVEISAASPASLDGSRLAFVVPSRLPNKGAAIVLQGGWNLGDIRAVNVERPGGSPVAFAAASSTYCNGPKGSGYLLWRWALPDIEVARELCLHWLSKEVVRTRIDKTTKPPTRVTVKTLTGPLAVPPDLGVFGGYLVDHFGGVVLPSGGSVGVLSIEIQDRLPCRPKDKACR